jgi:ribosomal protein S18 acetylase RimI-like enzyme
LWIVDLATFQIRALEENDREWVARFVGEQWGAPFVVSRGVAHYPERLPGFAAVAEGEIAGLITYRLDGPACEIVTLDSLKEGRGIGTALINAVAEAAHSAGCRRLWLITTNDNTRALRFYQKRGFTLFALHRNAIEQSRALKPSISPTGFDGIPIRDEIELEMRL